MQLKWTLWVAFLFMAFQAHAQAPEQKPLQIGLGMMGTAYDGDLTTNGDALYRFHPGFNFSFQFASEKLISPQLNAGFGRFVNQDRDIASVEGVQPNTFVDTRIFHVDFRLKARFLRDKAVHPYVSAGIGLLGYAPRDEDGNNLLDDLNTRNDGETYGSITASFPLSPGVEIELSPLLMVGLEYTYRPTGSDYLDNISQLGTKSGNDKIQALALSLYFIIDPNRSTSGGLRGKDFLSQ